MHILLNLKTDPFKKWWLAFYFGEKGGGVVGAKQQTPFGLHYCTIVSSLCYGLLSCQTGLKKSISFPMEKKLDYSTNGYREILAILH